MHILQTAGLSEKQVQDIKALESACRKYDRHSLTFPIEDGSLYFLLYDEEALLSVFSAFFNGIDAWECSAFTFPSERRKGYFSQLLNRFLEEAEKNEQDEEFDLVFAADESCIDTRETLEAVGAELWYQEHMMELQIADLKKINAAEDAACPVALAPSLRQQTASVCRNAAVHQLPAGESVYKIIRKASEIGSFRLDFRGGDVYFYGFEIAEPLRNHGLGTSAFSLLLGKLSLLPGSENRVIRLQVSGDNAAALALYKRAGFQITETISYYVY